MTHEEHLDLEALVKETRAALSPREADQARVLAALEQRLELPPTQQASAAQRFNSMHSNSGAAAAGSLGRWAVRALLPIAGVGAVALIAMQLRVSTPTPQLRPAQPVAAAVTDMPPPHVPELATDGDARELVPADQAPSQGDKSPPQKRKKPQRKKCRAANGRDQPCEIKSSETALAVAEAAPQPAAASLSRELEALRQAQRALRSGQAAQALVVLEAFEREANGGGVMQEERAAAATMARCALAQTEQDKQALYDEFAARYPKSAYAARLQSTCRK